MITLPIWLFVLICILALPVTLSILAIIVGIFLGIISHTFWWIVDSGKKENEEEVISDEIK